jgi:hypothetical protein
MGGKDRLTVTYDLRHDADVHEFVEGHRDYGFVQKADLGRAALRHFKKHLDNSRMGTGDGWARSGLIDLVTPRNVDFSQTISSSKEIVINVENLPLFLRVHNHCRSLIERLKKGLWTRIYVTVFSPVREIEIKRGQLYFSSPVFLRMNYRVQDFLAPLVELSSIRGYNSNPEWGADDYPFKVIGIEYKDPYADVDGMSCVANENRLWANVDGSGFHPLFNELIYVCSEGSDQLNIYKRMMSDFRSSEVNPENKVYSLIPWWQKHWHLYYTNSGAMYRD